MEDDRTPDAPAPERGGQNEIGYRDVDEDAEHDERGSQGPGAEPPPRENQRDD